MGGLAKGAPMPPPNALAQMVATAVPLNKLLGFEAIEAGAGKAAIRVGAPPLHLNHVGTMHAGILFSVAEAASGVALLSSILEHVSKTYPVVQGARIDYAAAAKGPITAHAEIEPKRLAEIQRAVAAGENTDAQVVVSLKDESGRE